MVEHNEARAGPDIPPRRDRTGTVVLRVSAIPPASPGDLAPGLELLEDVAVVVVVDPQDDERAAAILVDDCLQPGISQAATAAMFVAAKVEQDHFPAIFGECHPRAVDVFSCDLRGCLADAQRTDIDQLEVGHSGERLLLQHRAMKILDVAVVDFDAFKHRLGLLAEGFGTRLLEPFHIDRGHIAISASARDQSLARRSSRRARPPP